MRVLLISANTESINMPVIPVGLGAVAVATREAGHEVKLLDLMGVTDTEAAVGGALQGLQPDIIGVSVRNIDDQNMENPNFLLDGAKEVISRCRDSSSAPVVVGGAGYSIFPESALTYLGADMGICGEGEAAFPALLALLDQNGDLSKGPGLYLPGLGLQGERGFEKELDQFPIPDAGLWPLSAPMDEEVWAPIQTRRGCPMDCSYCSTASIEGRIIRRRTPGRVVEAMASYVDAGFERFHFVDNTFNLPPSYAKELCRSLISSGLQVSWRCILYPAGIDRELVEEMAKAGCKEVSLGFESGSERILRRMGKRYGTEDVRRASEMLQEYGINRIGFLLLGSPGETKQSVQESLAFADSLALETMMVTAGVRIYPHTDLARTAVKEGMINSQEDLLYPRSYMAGGLEGWLPETARAWVEERPNWIT